MSVIEKLASDTGKTEAASTAGTTLLISFCNQISSPDCCLCLFDRADRQARWIDFGALPEVHRNGYSGVCGVAHAEGHTIIATQGAAPALATVDVVRGQLGNYKALQRCKDPHSMVFLDGQLYIISTGSNQIYRVPLADGQFGEEELFWSYPASSDTSDEVHLNGLTLDGKELIASCFGPREPDGTWGASGRVFKVKSGKTICDGLQQPHTPMVSGNRLAVAESAAFKVHLYRKRQGRWELERELLLDGYTRGLAFQGDQLVAGVSASRELSRSQGQFVYSKPITAKDSQLVAIDLATGEPRGAWDLLLYGREPYDLIPAPQHSVLETENEAVQIRMRNIESWVARNAADMGSLVSQLRQTKSRLNQYETAESGLVSVIIPTYNRASFIEAAIRSVLAQTYTDLELIVVDDGSSDETASLVAGISDPRFRYIRQPNRGRSNARNHALSLANGKYITFLDSDDLYLPDKVQTQVNYLKLHPSTGMVYTSAHCINADGQRLPNEYVAAESGLIYDRIAFFTPVTITLPTVMTYKAVLDKVGGFDESMYRFEDTDMWRRISKHCRIDAMPEYTCLLRTHDDNSLINQQPERIVEALNYYAAKILREDKEVELGIRWRGLANLYRYYAQAFISLPQFSATGKKLLGIARTYDSVFIRMFPPDTALGRVFWTLYRGSRLDLLVYWVGRYARAGFEHGLHFAYRVYRKLKRMIVHD
jgi:glycosyltransferase involved in cell wall biosynthesis